MKKKHWPGCLKCIWHGILGDGIKVIQGIFSDGFRLFTDFAWLLRIALSI